MHGEVVTIGLNPAQGGGFRVGEPEPFGCRGKAGGLREEGLGVWLPAIATTIPPAGSHQTTSHGLVRSTSSALPLSGPLRHCFDVPATVDTSPMFRSMPRNRCPAVSATTA
jgi:hypothetical protein